MDLDKMTCAAGAWLLFAAGALLASGTAAGRPGWMALLAAGPLALRLAWMATRQQPAARLSASDAEALAHAQPPAAPKMRAPDAASGMPSGWLSLLASDVPRP